MGKVFTVIECSIITGLFTDTNLWVIYISLVIIFFLVGLILGLNIGTRKRLPKDDKTPDNNDSQNKSRQALITGSENKENQQIYNANQVHHSSHRHHRRSNMHIQ